MQGLSRWDGLDGALHQVVLTKICCKHELRGFIQPKGRRQSKQSDMELVEWQSRQSGAPGDLVGWVEQTE